MYELLFETFQFSSVRMITSAECINYYHKMKTNNEAALIIDSGYSFTHISLR